MKGLILSGGRGTRLRPITYSIQKQLIPVANKPVLFYCIEDLINAGIDHIGIVVGPNKELVMETVRSVEWDADIEFIYQDRPGGLAHAVLVSKEFLGDDRFIMYLGDNLLKEGIKDFVDDFKKDKNVEASLLLTTVKDPERYGIALVDEQKKVIVKLLEKPKQPPSNLSIVGIYGLTPTIFTAIEHIKPSWRGELEITDALQWLIENGYAVKYKMVKGWWKDTGKPEDIIDANRLILDTIEEDIKGEIEETCTIKGRVKIGENTVIKGNTIIRGPVLIGKNCYIENSYIGPYTTLGDNTRVINTEIEESVIMEGTTLEDVGRITDSLIGKSAILRKTKSLPKSHKLVIGDFSVIEL